jgi:hypothetical protein
MDNFTNEQPLEEVVLNINEEGSLFEEVEEETFGDSAVPMACHHHTHGYDDTEGDENEG